MKKLILTMILCAPFYWSCDSGVGKKICDYTLLTESQRAVNRMKERDSLARDSVSKIKNSLLKIRDSLIKIELAEIKDSLDKIIKDTQTTQPKSRPKQNPKEKFVGIVQDFKIMAPEVHQPVIIVWLNNGRKLCDLLDQSIMTGDSVFYQESDTGHWARWRR